MPGSRATLVTQTYNHANRLRLAGEIDGAVAAYRRAAELSGRIVSGTPVGHGGENPSGNQPRWVGWGSSGERRYRGCVGEPPPRARDSGRTGRIRSGQRALPASAGLFSPQRRPFSDGGRRSREARWGTSAANWSLFESLSAPPTLKTPKRGVTDRWPTNRSATS